MAFSEGAELVGEVVAFAVGWVDGIAIVAVVGGAMGKLSHFFMGIGC